MTANEKLHILNQTKELKLIPKLQMATTKILEEYFGITASGIRAFIRTNRQELTELGVKKFKGADLYKTDYDEFITPKGRGLNCIVRYGDFELSVTNSGLTLYPIDAIYFMAQRMNNGVAKAIQEHSPVEADAKEIVESHAGKISHDILNVYKKANVADNLIEHEEHIRIFDNPDFGSIRSIVIESEPWFVGKDVAAILGYERTTKAVADHVDVDDIDEIPIRDSIGRMQKTPIINESGLYSLILSSKLPSAKEFKRWVTSEILPSIRRHGTYMTAETIEQVLADPDTIIRIATELKNERQKNKELSAANEALVMKANTWDDQSILNALVRAFGSYRCEGNFVKAWNAFYKKLNYTQHINLRNRRSLSDKKTQRLINFLSKEEFKPALRVAVAMCESAGINAGEVINETNLAKIRA